MDLNLFQRQRLSGALLARMLPLLSVSSEEQHRLLPVHRQIKLSGFCCWTELGNSADLLGRVQTS